MVKKYKKDVTITYQFANTPESEQIVEQVFDKIFSHIIQKQKKLKNFFRSDEYKEVYRQLCKRKSILVDYLSIH